MTELTLEALRAELAPIRADIAAMQADIAVMRPRTEGLSFIGVAISNLQRETRLLRAAINDMARTEMTAGEATAIHDDLDAVMAKNLELETSIATLQRELRELKEQEK